MNRAGIYVDNLTGEAAHQSFKPNPLPPMPGIEMDEEIVKLLVDANKQLVKLDTASQLISNELDSLLEKGSTKWEENILEMDTRMYEMKKNKKL